MKKVRSLCWLVIAGVTTAFTAHAEEIVLNDGSTIQGEVESLANGMYTVNSATLGKIKIPKSSVQSVSKSSRSHHKSNEQSTASAAGQVQSIQNMLAQDPQAMKMIMDLQSNANVQAILNDPQLMQQISSGDLNALMNNDKIKKLMNDPQIEAVTKKVQ